MMFDSHTARVLRSTVRRSMVIVSFIMMPFPPGMAATSVVAAGPARVAVITPIESCEALSHTPLATIEDKPAHIEAAATLDTPKGAFCKVTGVIEPAIRFEVDLPVEHWTQRYVEGGCGGLCGMMPDGISNASSCAPALNGELVLASDDMGHQVSGFMSPDLAAFGADPQKRIDFAYRANHLTTRVAKTLIKAFYGRAPKYSYFIGCSDGGREALMEAQRYPDDFDGIVAGDPAALLTVQNSFGGAWPQHANARADGTNILMAGKATLIHDAVLAHCDTLSGVKDGLLQDPRACDFDPGSLTCRAGASDTAKCLTPEEVAALERLYYGAADEKGNHFTFGFERGSELQMHLPTERAAGDWAHSMAGQAVINLFLPEVSPAEGTHPFEFTPANFHRLEDLAPLYNATNTNLKPFAARGGKLILWHGWSDTLIPPGISIAYYQGVQAFMGERATNTFMRFFMLPGVGHCVGGDGYDEVDWMSPIMAWVERQAVPERVVTGKTHREPGPRPGERPRLFYATPAPPLTATRPVFAYPLIAQYDGKGNQADADSYVAKKTPVALPQHSDAAAVSLIGPDNQKTYGVREGQLVVVN